MYSSYQHEYVIGLYADKNSNLPSISTNNCIRVFSSSFSPPVKPLENEGLNSFFSCNISQQDIKNTNSNCYASLDTFNFFFVNHCPSWQQFVYKPVQKICLDGCLFSYLLFFKVRKSAFPRGYCEDQSVGRLRCDFHMQPLPDGIFRWSIAFVIGYRDRKSDLISSCNYSIMVVEVESEPRYISLNMLARTYVVFLDLPIESNSSIYTMHGARFFAWSNKSRTRAEPTPSGYFVNFIMLRVSIITTKERRPCIINIDN